VLRFEYECILSRRLKCWTHSWPIKRMPEFSLIVATKGRTSELARLISSLDKQDHADYELIIVDQNEDDRLVPIVQLDAPKERTFHLRCSPGVSRARNRGMDIARGKIIAFPDDDCWYPPGVLGVVSDWFDRNPSYDILALSSLDADGVCSGNRWVQDSCDLNLLNVYRTSIGYCYFVRSNGIATTVRYDEGIGPGADTPYLGGEDSDFILAAMKAGARGRFEAKWYIGHPLKDIRNTSISIDRAYVYGQGMGFVQRKHGLAWLSAAQLAFDYGRALCALALGRRSQAKLWYWHGRGLMAGFFHSGKAPLQE
jgi:glycosyltransferase involved in cell wall biosynthesis